MALLDEILADNPIILIRANDGVDHSGNNLDLTPFASPSSGPSLDISDPSGSSIALNGSNNIWNSTAHPELELEDMISISALIKPSSLLPDGSEIARKGGSYGIQIADNDTIEAFVSTGGFVSVASGPVVVADEILHVGMSYDGTDLHLYVNGVEVDSDPATGDLDLAGGSGFTIGLVNQGYVGLIDEVAVFGTALAPSRFAAYHAAAMGGGSSGGLRVRWGGEWVPATRRVRIDGEWVACTTRTRVDGAWV